MPGELIPVAILAIIFGSITLQRVVKYTLRYLSEREERNSGASLTTSELNVLLREAVNEATGPLEARIATLEKQRDLPRERTPRSPDDAPRADRAAAARSTTIPV